MDLFEISPDVQSEPALEQFEAAPSHPVPAPTWLHPPGRDLWRVIKNLLPWEMFSSLFADLFRDLLSRHKIKNGILHKIKILGQADKNPLKFTTAKCILGLF